MKIIRIIVLLILFIGVYPVFGQTEKIELIKEKLNNAPAEEKPHLLNLLSKSLLRYNRKESLFYADEAIDMASDLGDVEEEMAGYLNKGRALSKLNKHKKAIEAYEVPIKTDRDFGNDSGLAYLLTLEAEEFKELGDFSKSRKALEEAYSLYDKLSDEDGMGYVASERGSLEREAGKSKEAIKFYEKAVNHYKKSKNKQGEVQSLMTMGAINANRGDYDRSLELLNEAKALAKKYGFNSLQKSIEKNIEVVQSNKKAKESMTTEVDKERQEQIENTIENLETIKVKSLEQIEQLSEANQILALKERLQKEEYERKLKEEEEAKRQLEQQKKLAEAAALASKAEKEKQEVQNKLLEEENKKQLIMLIGVGVGMVLFAILIVFILKSNRERKKANEALLEKNRLIEEQKNVLVLQKEELEHKSKNIKESLDYAQKIQRSILPPIEGLQTIFSDSFVFFKPKDIVSGDFYWFYEYGDKVYVSVSDCTGHGVPGAFMSIIGNNLIEKAIIEEKIERPADVLKFMSEKINEKLGMDTGNSSVKDGMDMTLICIDKKTNKLSFAGARNPLYLLRDGKMQEIKATRRSVGYNSKGGASEFENVEIQLQKGDRLYMFSDGFADQKGGPKGKKFYYKPFREILEKTGTEPMEHQKDVLESTIVGWMNGGEQLDDMLVLGIQI